MLGPDLVQAAPLQPALDPGVEVAQPRAQARSGPAGAGVEGQAIHDAGREGHARTFRDESVCSCYVLIKECGEGGVKIGRGGYCDG